MAHTHLNSTVNSSSNPHGHSNPLGSTPCQTGYEHSHVDMLSVADNHQHLNVVLQFAVANLGSPNWWQHTHAIALYSMGSGGSLHNHPSHTLYADFCVWEMEQGGYSPHGHSIDGYSCGNSGASHTHTVTGQSTGYADQTGTPQNHVHPFSFSLDYANNHSHTLTGTVVSANCGYGIYHGHTYPSPSNPNAHSHTASGNSGTGGEEPPTAVVEIIGDGFSWVT